MNKKKMKLGTRLLLGFMSIATIALAIGLFGFIKIGTVGGVLDSIMTKSPLMDCAMEMKYNVGRDMQMLMEMLSAGNVEELDAAWKEHMDFVEAFDLFTGAILEGATIDGETIKAAQDDEIQGIAKQADTFHNDKFQGEIQKLYDLKKKEFDLRKSGADEKTINDVVAGLHLADKNADEIGGQMISLVGGVEEAVKKMLAEEQDRAGKTVISSKVMMIIGVLIGICAAMFLGFSITRSITLPINSIIDNLSEGSHQVSSASGQMSAASQSLAEGAAEQASSLEEISSSLEEMSSMTRQNADNAEQANTLAKESRKASEQGNEATKRMIAAMQEMQAAAEQTSKIVKTIDEIAFQTNLLALNAAVEAARAGEAGKGFAVVAEEVRNLAQRAGEAAKNTSELIEGSVNKTRDGAKIADEMAVSLDAIMRSSSKSSDLVAEIAAASREQAQGIDQVNVAVGQMDKVTQQNASNAEESASASEEMNSQAEAMNDVVVELAELVGRDATATSRPRTRPGSTARPAARNSAVGTHTIVHKQLANIHKTSAPAKTSGGALKPDDVIKFDEEDDFGEF